MEYPGEDNTYIELEHEGIQVFVNRGIKAKNDVLTIRLSGFLIFKTIEVLGIDINY